MDLPDGLRSRDATPDDIDRIVAFENRHARPGRAMDPALVRRFEAANPQPERRWLLVTDAGGAIVAVAAASDGGLFRIPDRGFRGGVRVGPEWRGRGIGSALTAELERHVRAKGGAKLGVSVYGDEPEGVRFAEKRGYVEYHRRIDSYIDVNAFDPSAFPDPERTAAAAGVRLVSYDELAREVTDVVELQRQLYDLNNAATRDIPRPDPIPDPPPFEVARAMFFDPPSFDTSSTQFAVRDGRVVAMTLTLVNPEGVAYTAMTGTARPERSKGLATALKLRALAVLRARGIALFGTTNDPDNGAMRGINRKLGYVPAPPTIQLEKRFG